MKHAQEKYFYDMVDTSFGEGVVVGRRNKRRFMVCRIMLPERGGNAAKRVGREFPGAFSIPGICSEICMRISDFFEGKEVDFDPADMDTSILTGFARRVLTRLPDIPRGRVMTYQGLAESLNVVGGARAVGNALAGNPFPLFLPCHRVIRSDGTLGEFGGGTKMKRVLLEFEGVSFDKGGRVRGIPLQL